MKEIQLTKGYVALVDDADYEWLNQWKWHIISTHNGRHIAAKRTEWPIIKSVYMHRAILGLTHQDDICDHIDGNPLNNQRHNLRVCNKNQNAQNSRPNKGKEHKGVSFFSRDSVWVARITVDNKCLFLGRFNTKRQALMAYNDAAIKYHGEFAWLNPITD